MGFKVKEGVSKVRCPHSARLFKTGKKSRRISKKAHRSARKAGLTVTLSICSGCGQTMKES